jgi:hypothetical protein
VVPEAAGGFVTEPVFDSSAVCGPGVDAEADDGWVVAGSGACAAKTNAKGISNAQSDKPSRPVFDLEKQRPAAALIRHPGAPPICGNPRVPSKCAIGLETTV